MTTAEIEPTVTSLTGTARISNVDLENVLKIFYERLFPAKTLCRWLAGGDGSAKPRRLAFRELSFTLANDVYLRYQSYDGSEALVSDLIRMAPVKIDIGAVYSAKPSDRRTVHVNNFRPLEKELVFDIDMTDYDDVRTCCKDKQICQKCWKFIAVAVRVIDRALKGIESSIRITSNIASYADDFGFMNRLWVFSGRRGAHCWVSDERARQLSPAGRKAIVSYLELQKGGADVKKRVSLHGDYLHPSIRHSMGIIAKYFPQVAFVEQDVLASPAGRAKVLALINDEILRGEVIRIWSDYPDSTPAEFWEAFEAVLEQAQQGRHRTANNMLKAEIQLQLLYPRLDANVSIQLNHLLKSPFCVHPDTDKICVPFLAEDVDDFNPLTVPTLTQLLGEMDALAMTGQEEILFDPLLTSLKPYYELFNRFVQGLAISNGPMSDPMEF